MRFYTENIEGDPLEINGLVFGCIVRVEREHNLLFEELVKVDQLKNLIEAGSVMVTETQSEILCFTNNEDTAVIVETNLENLS